MSNEFKVDVELRRSEVFWYNLSHIRWIVYADIIGLVAFFVMVYQSFTHPDPGIRDLLGTVSIWVAIALAIGLSQPFVIFMQVFWPNSPAFESLRVKRSYLIDLEGIGIRSMGLEAKKKWNEIVKIQKIRNIILIYTGKKKAYVIPKRCFADIKLWDEFIRFLLKAISSK
jgi:hypothetical protein